MAVISGKKVVYGRLATDNHSSESQAGREHKPKLKVRAIHKSVEPDHMRLVITKGDLDEFRCEACNALLFKGLNLEKSMIEVKCRSCGALLVSDALHVIQ